MIEAVNSVVANAALLRGNTDQSQQDRLNAIASNPNTERVKMALAPFVSPFIQVNNDYNKAVLQLRDSETGDVINQFPSETTMRARAAQAEIQSQEVQVDTQDRSGSAATSTSSNLSATSGNESLQGALTQSASPRIAEAQIASSVLAAGGLSSASAGVGSVNVFA
jgi:hypothetical protein